MSQTQDTIVAALMEQLIAEGPEGMAQVFTALFNLAMRLERERFLGAGLYERNPDRRGYANGYKSKTLDTTAGTVTVDVPEQTKFRPIEELRPTYSSGGSRSEGFAAGWQQGLTQSNSVGRALARGTSSAETVSASVTESESLAHARTLTRTLGSSRGESTSHMDLQSTADSAGAGVTHSAGSAQTKGEAQSVGESAGESTVIGTGDAASRSQLAYGVNTPVTLTAAESAQRQQGESKQDSRSQTSSQSQTESQNRGNSLSVQHVDGHAVADTSGTQRSSQESAATGSGETQAASRGEQHGTAATLGKSQTTTNQETVSLARQFSLSGSRQESSSESCSVAVGPFHRMEEFKEETVHYWSLPEQRHRLVAALKNQGVAEATFHIGQQPPVRVKVDEVVAPPWLPRTSPRAIVAFREKVYAAAPEYYQTPGAAQAEIRARQTKRFARAFDYDWFQPALPPGSIEILPPSASGGPAPGAEAPPAAVPSRGRTFTR